MGTELPTVGKEAVLATRRVRPGRGGCTAGFTLVPWGGRCEL